jgi:protein-tyrosine phosphatase
MVVAGPFLEPGHMPDIARWNTEEPAAALTPVVRHLEAGRIVLLPTESTYELAAAALHAEAAGRLPALAADGDAPALVLTGPREADDWLPALTGPGRRLVRKVGAGPWKLRADGGARYGLLGRLPETVQRLVSPDGQHVALRYPDHPAWAWTIRRLRGPLVSVATRITSPEQAAALGAEVAAVVDGGPSPFGQLPTVVRVTGERWEVERAGNVPAEQLAEILLYRILFICTGNTCRSPMAEALCRRLLAEQLGCPEEELERRGFRVQSAGLAAMMGGGAAEEALVTVRELGADLSSHRSQALTGELLALADRVYTMTTSHLRMLHSAVGSELPAAALLSPVGEDVVDPIGSELDVYRACAQEILEHLRKRLPELQSR